jgi:hypothetical protein
VKPGVLLGRRSNLNEKANITMKIKTNVLAGKGDITPINPCDTANPPSTCWNAQV